MIAAISPLPVCSDVAKLPNSGKCVAKSIGLTSRRLHGNRQASHLGLMVLLTVSCGYVLGMETASISFTLIHACLGIAVVAVGSSAVNQ